MTRIVPISYLPDVESWWGANPGALMSMSQFAPLARGSYGSVGNLKTIEVTGTNILLAKMFRKTDGTCRFLVFRVSDIDDYTNAGVKTNQGTSYSSSTASWSAAGFGSAVVACNYLNDTQISTGTTFSAIGSGCPKARLVAANSNFTMLADYNDGSNQYSDGWWCSALGNAASWTASLSTQAANGRILDVSGPIRSLVAYKDGFIAFKDNSIHVMEYVGPPFIWSVRTVSNQVGAHGARSVCELRGVLYFAHSSGLYSYDGASIASVGDAVETTYLKLANGITRESGAVVSGLSGVTVADVQVVADDVENVIWFTLPVRYLGEGAVYESYHHSLGYNVFSRKWGAFESKTNISDLKPVIVDTSNSDAMQFFAGASATYVSNAKSGRLWVMQQTEVEAEKDDPALWTYAYPFRTNGDGNNLGAASFTTGMIGNYGEALRTLRVYWHLAYDFVAFDDANDETGATAPFASVKATVHKSAGNVGSGGKVVNGTINTEFDCADINAAGGSFVRITATTVTNATCEVYGLGVDSKLAGLR